MLGSLKYAVEHLGGDVLLTMLDQIIVTPASAGQGMEAPLKFSMS